MHRVLSPLPVIFSVLFLLASSTASLAQPSGGQAPENETTDAALQILVDAEAERIKNDPPVHERPEPWAVPVAEFINELQPLTLDEIDERLGLWIELLKTQIRERNRLEIAAPQITDNDELRRAIVDRAADHTAQITGTVERIKAGLKILRQRGGDATAYQRYIDHAPVVMVDISNWTVLLDQGRSWLTRADGGIALGVRIGTFLAIIIAFFLVSRIVAMIVASAVGRLPKASSLLRDFLAGGARRIVMLIGLVVALDQLGVNIGPLVAAIGAAGLVVGLALQGTLGNFASGILILIYRPYDVGDVITAGGASGKVESMNLVSTRIGTFDNQVIFVPNSEIWGGVIQNVTARDTRRVDLVFGIGYTDDIAKAESIINAIIADHPMTLADPAPTVKVHELADNSVNFIARPWCKAAEYWDVYWDITRQVKERFDAESIGIPFPQRDLHVPGPVEVIVKNA